MNTTNIRNIGGCVLGGLLLMMVGCDDSPVGDDGGNHQDAAGTDAKIDGHAASADAHIDDDATSPDAHIPDAGTDSGVLEDVGTVDMTVDDVGAGDSSACEMSCRDALTLIDCDGDSHHCADGTTCASTMEGAACVPLPACEGETYVDHCVSETAGLICLGSDMAWIRPVNCALEGRICCETPGFTISCCSECDESGGCVE